MVLCLLFNFIEVKDVSEKETQHHTFCWSQNNKYRRKKQWYRVLFPTSQSTCRNIINETHLMHVWIYEDFKGPHSQGDVGGRSGDGEDIVESLLPHIMGVDGLHQISTGHCHHGSIHGELQLPRTQLWVGVYTREPESAGGDNLMNTCTLMNAPTTAIMSFKGRLW